MKKTNLLLFLFSIFLFSACEAETEKDKMNDFAALSGKIKIQPLNPQTRSGGFTPFWAVGEKVGLYLKTETMLEGPLPFTIASLNGSVIFSEVIPFVDNSSLHTFYAYHPFEANDSANPEEVSVAPVAAEQVQQGTSSSHINSYEFNIAAPATIYPDEDLILNFTSSYSFFEFQINSNINGLVVKSIKVEAAPDKMINFTDAYVNITLSNTHPDFARYFNVSGGTPEIELTIDGGLSIPNSAADYASGYMVFNPFNGIGENLKITVTTEDDQTFEFDEEAQNYLYGQRYVIPIYLEAENPQPTIKDIKILSLCEVGNLGTKDNTKPWTCYYGAKDLHAKELRRLLYEHFGKGKTVETGVISFETIDIKTKLNKVTDAYLDQFDIIYLNNNARPDLKTAAKIMNWLDRSENRVLMLAYDWKASGITPSSKESSVICSTTTNYLIFRDHIYGVTPHWYNSCIVNKSIGNWGASRDGILVPFELNAETSYFWQDGPFKTDLKESSDLRYWIEDCWWGAAEVSDPDVIPLVTYRDAKDASKQTQTHKYGAGDYGMVLGVDPVKRIVYIGDSEIFSVSCVNSKVEHARMSKEGTCKPNDMNNFSKVVGNLWAWMIQGVVQKSK